MEDNKQNNKQEIKEEAKKEETKIESTTGTKENVTSLDTFSNNLIIENQKKMVLQIEALEKRLAEAKKNEERLVSLLRDKEAKEKARIQNELIQNALKEYPVLSNAKGITVNMIKEKLSFNDKQEPLWQGNLVDENGLKNGLEAFFKENSFLLDKSVKTQTAINGGITVKQQPGKAGQKYDMRTVEGMNEFLRIKMNGGKK
jgi:hypothetical protein